MSKRRSFVPAAPMSAILEDRLAPSNIFGLGSRWDKLVEKLGIRHHHNAGNTAIVAQAWKEAAKATPQHHLAAGHHVAAQQPITFK